MIDSIEQIQKDINYESEDLINVNFDKFPEWADCNVGDKICWCYLEDVTWWKKEKYFGDKPKDKEKWIKNACPNQGLLFTLEDHRFRIDENAVVCCYNYCIEKENPTCFWISLDRLLIAPDLYKVYKI